MSDFITMQCPNCGGKLSVGSNAISLKCEHCGTEHMIRRDAGNVILESYARCPVCNRNDRVEKVSAILRSQTQKSQGVTYQQQVTTVRVGDSMVPVTRQVAVPTQSSQVSDLAKHLSPPPRPNVQGFAQPVSDGVSHAVLVFSIVTAVLGVGMLVCSLIAAFLVIPNASIDTSLTISLLLGIFTLVPIGVSILLFIFALPRENKKNREKKALAEERRRQIQAQAEEQMRRWNLAVERWNHLYYCGRDDCVFLPGKNSYAPITEIAKYLSQ